jgi:hypothetical protein
MLLDGDARTRPRSHATLRVHFGIVRPFIERWAATRGHLREITSGDVDTFLDRCTVTGATTPSWRCARCSGSPIDAA